MFVEGGSLEDRPFSRIRVPAMEFERIGLGNGKMAWKTQELIRKFRSFRGR